MFVSVDPPAPIPAAPPSEQPAPSTSTATQTVSPTETKLPVTGVSHDVTWVILVAAVLLVLGAGILALFGRSRRA